jgi:hypothetical protein
MSLKWYCKGRTEDHGPFTFQDLVMFVRAGKLAKNHVKPLSMSDVAGSSRHKID